jgi:PTH1 family peptidyl-tRNA hydrolase
MKLFVGLGNPGAKYAGNRHNIGFMAVDRIAADHGIGPWRTRFQGQIAEGRLGPARMALLKPGTFMNLSGQSVGEAMRFFKIEPADVVVFHDELDLAPGKLRCKTGGGHAGHNGLRSIHAHIGEGYDRVRLGIGHPGRKELVSAYVLHDFAKADADWLEDLMRGISDGAAALAAGDAARFQNAVALRTAPPRSGGGGAAPGKGAATGKGTSSPEATQPDSAPPEPALPEPGPQNPSPNAKDAQDADTPDNRSLLQRLAERFR